MEALETTVEIQPLAAICQECCGLIVLEDRAEFAGVWSPEKDEHFRCPICGVRYEPTDLHATAGEYLYSLNLVLDRRLREPRRVDQFRTLSHRLDQGDVYPVPALLRALDTATQAVHFVANELDEKIAEALVFAARKARVRGVVGPSAEGAFSDMPEAGAAGSRFRIRVIDEAKCSIPAEAVVVIDGAAALSGPPALTSQAWADPSTAGPRVRLCTDLRDIALRNNQQIALRWWSLGERSGALHMGYPF